MDGAKWLPEELSNASKRNYFPPGTSINVDSHVSPPIVETQKRQLSVSHSSWTFAAIITSQFHEKKKIRSSCFKWHADKNLNVMLLIQDLTEKEILSEK